MSDNIPPYEIQLEIIKKVHDLKALVRFRSVSKHWKSFIDDREFIAGYGTRPTQPHRLLLRYTHYNEVKYVSFVDGENDILTQQQNFSPNVSDLVKHLKYPTRIGSSCGLWCLHGYNRLETQEMVVFWNPSIRKSVGIVMPRFLKSLPGHAPPIGFGVSPSNYDPTIVGMSFQTDPSTHKQIISSVGVFTLSSKTWKMLPSSNLPRESIELLSLTSVTIDRFIYWEAWDRTIAKFSCKRLILSFDLITHEFKELHLSDSIAKQAPRHVSMSKLNESLVLCGIINEVNDELVYGVWMMGDEGSAMPSFTKLFNIKIPDSSLMTLLGFRKNGEPIIQTLEEDSEFGELGVYEPCSEHMNYLEIYGEDDSFFICPYKESLLLADHSDGYIISNDY